MTNRYEKHEHSDGHDSMVQARTQSGCLPYAHGGIMTCRGQVLTIGGPCDISDVVSVAAIDENGAPGEKLASCAGVPDLHSMIVAGGGNATPHQRPGDGIDPGAMVAMGKDINACRGIPDVHGIVPGTGGNAGAAGRPGQ